MKRLRILAGDVRQDLMFVGQFDPKHRPGKNGEDFAFNLDWLFH